MLSLSSFLFFAFLFCCTCKNQLGYTGSYEVEIGAYPITYSSAFTVTKDQAKEIVESIDFDAYSDFAAIYASGNKILATEGTDHYLCESSGVYKGVIDEAQNKMVFTRTDQEWSLTFYPYKGDIRKTIKQKFSDGSFSAAFGEKVTKEEFLNEINYPVRAPNFAKYTEYFIVRYSFRESVVGILTNSKDGVIDVAQKKKDTFDPFYNSCHWVEKILPEDPDKIDCNDFTVEFTGVVISGVSATVVSCLVLIISVLVFTLL